MGSSFLPVGSVVSLAASGPRVMVLGFGPSDGQRRFDYLGVAYPSGLAADGTVATFDADDIAEVCFVGHLDEEGRRAFRVMQDYAALEQEAVDRVERFAGDLDVQTIKALEEEYALLQPREGDSLDADMDDGA